MRYLVTIDYGRSEDQAAATPTAERIEQTVVPTLEACAKLEADGKIVAGGVEAGAGSVTLIVDAASTEELNQLVQQLPAWGSLQVVVTPLQSFGEAAAHERETLSQKNASSEPTVREELHQRLGQLRDWAGK